jgi:hypothetical protein
VQGGVSDVKDAETPEERAEVLEALGPVNLYMCHAGIRTHEQISAFLSAGGMGAVLRGELPIPESFRHLLDKAPV